jgi:hypothetical protein
MAAHRDEVGESVRAALLLLDFTIGPLLLRSLRLREAGFFFFEDCVGDLETPPRRNDAARLTRAVGGSCSERNTQHLGTGEDRPGGQGGPGRGEQADRHQEHG